MQIVKFGLVFLASILLLGCRKEIPFPDVEKNALLVVNGFLNPEKKLEIHVSESCDLNDSLCRFNFISDAVVLLEDMTHNETVQLYHRDDGIYTHDNFILKHESSYHIEVGHQDKIAESLCDIPKPFTCRYLDKEELIFENQAVWGFDIEIVDAANEENYYLLDAYIDIEGRDLESSGIYEVNGYIYPRSSHYTNDINAENSSITAGIDYIHYPLRRIFLPDDNFDGQTYTTRILIRDFDVLCGEFEKFEAQLSIKSVNKDMYEYQKSLEKRRLTSSNLFAEPELTYTNIENGVGIFAGYTEQKFQFELPKSEFVLPRDIMVKNNGCVAPCTVDFITAGGSRLKYFWNFGDGNTSTKANPSHEYMSAGSFRARLEISGGENLNSSYGERITIR